MANYIVGLALVAAVWLVCRHLYKSRNTGCAGCRYREHCTNKDAQ